MTGEIAEGTCFNPTQSFWVGLAGNETAMTFIGYLVPLGQIGIGISLILGLFTRFGATMGALMMLVFSFAAWDFAYGIVNQHLTYMVVCIAIAGLGAGNYYGLDRSLKDQVGPAVRRWILSGERLIQVPAEAA